MNNPKTPAFLGIDLGTSSVKLILVAPKNSPSAGDTPSVPIIRKSGASYEEISPAGWYAALCRAARELELSAGEVTAVGLSSQVGTYIINGTDVLSWNDPCGQNECAEIKRRYPKDTFLREIRMPHPDIASYPLPRLLHISENFSPIREICMPKDILCEHLTGQRVSDPYSWRGLSDTVSGRFSPYFLSEITKWGIPSSALPPLCSPVSCIGTITETAAGETGIPAGTPVYLGMNDFFCSLVGMGMTEVGDAFDITGTSEHLGVMEDILHPDTAMVSSPYPCGGGSGTSLYVHYGVTASSGASQKFSLSELGVRTPDIEGCLARRAPIFLPYLNGERAPIFDPDARGTFFGIGTETTREDLAYAVLEGVAFSLYHIYTEMGSPALNTLRVSGGASRDPILNRLKALLLGTTLCTLSENDTSALGAAMCAAVGCGFSAGFSSAAEVFNRPLETFSYHPDTDGELRRKLLDRFAVYRGLYPTLKGSFGQWKTIL